MQTIEIKYRPIPFINWKRSITGQHPDNWSDVTPRQLRAIVSGANGHISDYRFISQMTGIPVRTIRRLSNFEVFQLNKLFSFITTSPAHNAFIIDKITIARCTYFAPLSKLKKMSFGQFIFADTHFGNWHEKQEPAEAALFLASLYLPKNTKFSEDITEKNAKIFSRANMETAGAVTLNYRLIKEWLANAYPLVFQAGEPGSGNQEPSKPRDQNAWIKIFESMVGDEIINHDSWADMPIHTVLRYMNRKIKENMKRKK